jgi:hypothetical protein
MVQRWSVIGSHRFVEHVLGFFLIARSMHFGEPTFSDHAPGGGIGRRALAAVPLWPHPAGRDRESNHPCRADPPPALALERDAGLTRMNDTIPARVNAMHAPMRMSSINTTHMNHAGPTRIRDARHTPVGVTRLPRIGAIRAPGA